MKIYSRIELPDYIQKPREKLGGIALVVSPLHKVLEQKELFLIDVFNTFIPPQPANDENGVYHGRTLVSKLTGYEAEGVLVEGVPLRKGFREFLEHYRSLRKKVAIHSDSLSQEDFEQLHEYWGFEGLVDEYLAFRKEDLGKIKRFHKAMVRMHTHKDKAIVIGDGLIDFKSAFSYGIDFLLVPTISADPDFDFRDLTRPIT